jgi:RHS repeat-associated protein
MEGFYSNIIYDLLGRDVEAGQNDEPGWNLITQDNINNYTEFPVVAHGSDQQVYTYYSDASTDLPIGEQEYLLNRVSWTQAFNKNVNGTTDEVRTYYSYDPHGNVKKIIRKLPGMPLVRTEYEYDLISGKVNKVLFNNGLKSAFYHRYEYDDDNRLTAAYTSNDNVIWDKDAAYEYYLHGPLMNVKIGQDKIQKIDYAYTNQGWLKAINNPFSNSETEYENDKFAMMLEYFNGDFSNSNSPFDPTSTPSQHLHGSDLYNGNISTWIINNFQGSSTPILYGDTYFGYTYGYDKLNRIKSADSKTYSFSKLTYGDPALFDIDYTYDGNGNLFMLNRNGNNSGNPQMDQLGYHYYDGTNRLRYVDDAVLSGVYADIDIDDQADGDNYTYDANGNMTRDNQEGITVTWNLQGKIHEVIPDLSKDERTQDTYLQFSYDTEGNRIKKLTYTPNSKDFDKGQFNFTFSNPENLKVEYYILDASGNVMSIYERSIVNNGTYYTAVYKLMEQPLYGSDRLGVVNTEEIVASYDFTALAQLDAYEPTLSLSTSENVFLCLPLKYLNTQQYKINTYNYDASNQYAIMDDDILYASFGVNQNIAIAETPEGVLKLKAHSFLNTLRVPTLWVYSNGSSPFYTISSNTFKCNVSNRIQAFKRPLDDNRYILISSYNNMLYYHVFDVLNQTVESIENQIGTIGNYTGHYTVVEDIYNNKVYVYAISGAPSVYKINKITFADINGELNINVEQIGTNITANSIYDLEASADGQKLALFYKSPIPTEYNRVQVYNIKGESINSYNLATGDVNYTKGQVEFDNTGNSVYVSYYNLQGKATKYYNNGTWVSLTYTYGDLKRGKNGYVYHSVNGSNLIKSYQLNEVKQTITDSSLNHTFIGVFPSQSVKYYAQSPDEVLAYRELDQKSYEIKDHLGNIRVTLSDQKSSSLSGSNVINDAITRVINNYYPFGMLQPGRYTNSELYRYAFQGQEKDKELYGEGNSYSFKYRIHDARLGRFLSVDPLTVKYPFYSPYAFSGNRVIDRNELEGLETGATHAESYLQSKSSGISIVRSSEILFGNEKTGEVMLTGMGNFIRDVFVASMAPFEMISEMNTSGALIDRDRYDEAQIHSDKAAEKFTVALFDLATAKMFGTIFKGLNSTRGLIGSKFAQNGNFSNEFSDFGKLLYGKMAGKPINTVDDLANAIKDKVINPDDLVINYVMRDGERVILNTRTSAALNRAGIPMNKWNGVDVTGVKVPGLGETTFDDLMEKQIEKNYKKGEALSNQPPK